MLEEIDFRAPRLHGGVRSTREHGAGRRSGRNVTAGALGGEERRDPDQGRNGHALAVGGAQSGEDGSQPEELRLRLQRQLEEFGQGLRHSMCRFRRLLPRGDLVAVRLAVDGCPLGLGGDAIAGRDGLGQGFCGPFGVVFRSLQHLLLQGGGGA
ncbi:hypothetical protein OG948_36380 (plasmid) [Embleya sp. NBC_00888]|uniref:hypothetical protein n=1 Tax=Embleya sp. NBC_00888 TaxID=2975960 RepID=UPI002F90B6B0|nr:hypothetical protein OG948_36380 [Embleya sp. NBC_00888]